jgi:TonB family protein
MMDALADRLAPLWLGVVAHLWQTALFLGALAIVARALRGASARILGALYWVGIFKLLVPLPLLGPVAGRLLESIAGASAAAPAAEAGWATVTVLMYPELLDPGSPGWAGPPAPAFLALTAVWLVVASLFFVRELRSRSSRRRLARRCLDARSGEAPALLRGAIEDAGLSLEEVRVSSESPGPFVRGGLRPVIVLPEAVLGALDRDELRAVLIHEREHLRRRDPLRYAALGLVRAVFWFYPPVWWLSRRIRETTEMACDEAVVGEGLPASTFCRSLARTLSLGLAHRAAVSPVGILGHRPSFLRRRLERIRSGRRFETMFSHRVTVTAAALAALVVSILPLVPGDGLTAHAGEFATGEELKQLAGADAPLTLHLKQARLAEVLPLFTEISGIEFRVVGDIEDRLVDINTGPEMPLSEVLRRLGVSAGLKFRVLGPREVEVMPILLAHADGVTMPVLIPETKVSPGYPEEARKNGIRGRVILQAIVDRAGTVSDVEVLNSEPEDYQPFIESAIDAVQQWRYEPATRDGEPVDVYFTLKIQFALDEHKKDL